VQLKNVKFAIITQPFSIEFFTAVKIDTAVFWVMTYRLVEADHEMIRGCGVFGAVRGTGVYRQDNSTAVGRSVTLFYNYTQTKNVKAFWLAGRGEWTVKMLLGWVVASNHLPVHVPHS